MKKRILFVDDQPNMLAALRRLLYCHRDAWEMAFASSGKEALNLLAQRDYDVVVTDMKMPGMNGAELLESVRKLHPRTARIVLSGQADEAQILQSIGNVHQYLSKPCDAQTLKATVTRACALRDRLADSSLRQLVSQVTTLPSLPTVYTELIKELQSSDVSMQRVCDLISRDVAIATKVLQLVNTAFFGLPRRVESPSQAASYLGVNLLRPVVLSAGIFAQFKVQSLCGFSLDQFTNHSLAVSRVAQQIATDLKADRQTIGDSLLVGLMHDVGQLLLVSSLPLRFQAALDYARERHVVLFEAEREVLGADHAKLGAHLLALWGFPDPIVEAVAYHHEPSESSSESITPLTTVHIANALVNQCATESSMLVDGDVDASYLNRVGVDQCSLPIWTAFAKTVVLKESVNDPAHSVC